MNHLFLKNYLENLSSGNNPKNIQLNEFVRNQLVEMDVGVGRFNPNTEQVEQLIGDSIETIQPFVFTLFDLGNVANLTPEEELSLPFKATWIELFDGPLFSETVHGQMEVDQKGTISIDPLYYDAMSPSEVIKGKKMRVTLKRDLLGALIIEPSNPGDAYQAIMYQETTLTSVHPDDNGEVPFNKLRARSLNNPIFRESYAGVLYHSMASGPYSQLGPEGKLYRAAQSLLSSMRKSSSEVGTVRVDIKSKVGTGNNRRLMKIKNLVVITPKKQKENVAVHIGAYREIDWSHRWDVMGHWRKTGGIGKDRNGDYSIKGYTWVVPHMKGPEEKVYIKKTRLVTSEESEE